MDGLSTELKQEVCENLQATDLGSLRQVSKAWATIAAVFLFKELSVAPISLDNLVNVARHENLRRCVRTFNFYSYRLPFILPEIWHEARKDRYPNMTERERGAEYEAYILFYRKQEKYDRSYLLKAMPHLLKKLSNLQTIRVSSNASRPIHGNTAPYLMTRDRSTILWWLTTMGHCEPDKDQLLVFQGDFIVMIDILSSRVCNFVTSFEIDTVLPGCWCTARRCNPKTTPRLAFRQLRKLRVSLCGWEFLELDVRAQLKDLGLCLENANALEQLVLQTERPAISQTLDGTLDLLLGLEPSLPRLKALELYGFWTTPASLQGLLGRYRHTLESLVLCNIHLVDRNEEEPWELWPRFLDTLTCHGWRLGHLHLDTLIYSGHRMWGGVEESRLDQYRTGRCSANKGPAIRV